MKRRIVKAIGKTQQEIVDDLQYFIRMPFKAQYIEDTYWDILRPLYHEDTGLYVNNTCELFKWALNYVKK